MLYVTENMASFNKFNDLFIATMMTLSHYDDYNMWLSCLQLPEDWRLFLEKEPIGLPLTHTVLFLLICFIFSVIVSIKCMCVSISFIFHTSLHRLPWIVLNVLRPDDDFCHQT
jgi:hypothetical protein